MVHGKQWGKATDKRTDIRGVGIESGERIVWKRRTMALHDAQEFDYHFG
jgi:hypothetical protein